MKRKILALILGLMILIGGIAVLLSVIDIWGRSDSRGGEKVFHTQSMKASQELTPGRSLGYIYIPSISLISGIYEGTTASELNKGVGHFSTTPLPGARDNSLLLGRSDSFFSGLSLIRRGDSIVVTSFSVVYKYEVVSVRAVRKQDRTLILPTYESTLTLTTNFPFEYSASAPTRYIVSAERIEDN